MSLMVLAAAVLIHLFATPDLALTALLGHAAAVSLSYTAGFAFAYLPLVALWRRSHAERALPIWLLSVAIALGFTLGLPLFALVGTAGLTGGGGHQDPYLLARLTPVGIIIAILILASERARQIRLELVRIQAAGRSSIGPPPKVAPLELLTGRRLILVDPAEIAFVAAQENYCQVALRSGERPLVRSTLSEFAEQLPGDAFARTHRSFLVNLAEIERIEPFNRAYAARLRDVAEPVPVSRGYVGEVAAAWRRSRGAG